MAKLRCPDLDTYRVTRMEFNKDIKNKDYPLSMDFRKVSKLEELGLLGDD